MDKNNILEKYNLRELIDFDLIQPILNDIYKITSVNIVITDLDDIVVTYCSCPENTVCHKFHLKSQVSSSECRQSERILLRQAGAEKKQVVRKCAHGLTDGVSPIIVDDEYIGAIFFGQYMDKEPDMEFFRKQSEKCGFDTKEYLEAVKKAPVINHERINLILSFIENFSRMVERTIREKFTELEEKQYLLQQLVIKSTNFVEKQNLLIKKFQVLLHDEKALSSFLEIDKEPLKIQEYLNDRHITKQEYKIYYYVIRGSSNKEISRALFISPETVKKHISNIFRKLQVKNRFELVKIINGNSITAELTEK